MIAATVRPARIHQAETIVHQIATTLAEGPLGAYLVPDPLHRYDVLEAVWRIRLGHADAHGYIHVINHPPLPNGLDAHALACPDPCGVAVWIWAGQGEWRPKPPNYRHLAEVSGPHIEHLLAAEELLAKQRPTVSHHYLAALAVCPLDDDHSLESGLLKHHHDVLDQIGIAAYLETTDPRLRDRCQERGYRIDATTLPESTEILWRLWRPAADMT